MRLLEWVSDVKRIYSLADLHRRPPKDLEQRVKDKVSPQYRLVNVHVLPQHYTIEVHFDSFDHLKPSFALLSALELGISGWKFVAKTAATRETVEKKIKEVLKGNTYPADWGYDAQAGKLNLNYLTPVRISDIKALMRKETGFNVEVYVDPKAKRTALVEQTTQKFGSFKDFANYYDAARVRTSVTGLGGCGRIGNSSFLLHLDDVVMLLDCGADINNPKAPKLSDSEISKIGYVVLSHAHEDHGGLIPYLYKKGCKAKLICTQPTLEIAKLLWQDSIKIAGEQFFSAEDIGKTINHAMIKKYAEPIYIKDKKLSLINAGHMLGSAMTHIEHKGKSILYTGDFVLHNSLLEGAKMPEKIDFLITETTYGNQEFSSYKLRKNSLVKKVANAIKRGGVVLIPSFAAGRGQEVAHALYQGLSEINCEIYIDGLMRKVNNIYANACENQGINGVREDFKKMMDCFTPIDHQNMRNEICYDGKPKVILTTSGMLTGGPVLMYLQHLCHDRNNLVLLAGYQAQGTLGRKLMTGKKENYDGVADFEIGGVKRSMNAELDIVHLSAHADKNQLMHAFSNKPIEKIFAVHGEGENLDAFVTYASQKFKAKEVCALQPDQEIEF